MQTTKILSKALFYISRILSLLYFGTFLYAVICLLTNWGIEQYENRQFIRILYPITNTPFLNIDNNTPYIIFSFLLPIFLYGLFFWLTGNVFKIFFQPKLFTQSGVRSLKIYYLANMILPLLSVVISSIFVPIESIVSILVVVHFVLGIFAYFLAAIFKQGLKLQNEQELFI